MPASSRSTAGLALLLAALSLSSSVISALPRNCRCVWQGLHSQASGHSATPTQVVLGAPPG
eukprot:15455609-Alexandrium_andersonii.AAC.1